MLGNSMMRRAGFRGSVCDTPLAFTTGGDAPWFSQGEGYYSDYDAAQSGAIGDNQSTWLETTVLGQGTISFYWYRSCLDGDGLSFSIDGQVESYISGVTPGWGQITYTISTFGLHRLRWTYDKDASGTAGEDCGRVDCVRWMPAARTPSTTLAEALDTSLDVVTSSNYDYAWQRVTDTYYNGGDSAVKGPIGDDQTSQMEVWVQGAGSGSFYWKVSSEASCDYLEFYLDGVRQDRISGEVDWTQKTYTVTGSGPHSLLWQYKKDAGDAAGADSGWVDALQWTPSSSASTDWTEVEYLYDPSGRRIAKVFDGVVTHKYVYDGDNLICEYNGADALVRKFIHGPSIDQPISMIDVEDANAVYYYHFDGLGSVMALSNSSGACVETYEYSVFGEVAASDPTNPNPFTFTGREFDKETGLYFYRARYYNPAIGRFLQTDPAQEGTNWYTYCANNPANLLDPSGCNKTYTNSIPTGCVTDTPNAKTAEIDFRAWMGRVCLCYTLSTQKFAGWFVKEIKLEGGCYVVTWETLDDNLSEPAWNFGRLRGADIAYFNGIGLLDDRTLNLAIKDDINRVNTWWQPGYTSLIPVVGLGATAYMAWHIVMECDTVFHNTRAKTFAYGGQEFLGEEINYILEGHAMAHFGICKAEAWSLVYAWKWGVQHEAVSTGVLTWFWKGYVEYLDRTGDNWWK